MVRKAVADLLTVVPEDSYDIFLKELLADSHGSVRNAAENARKDRDRAFRQERQAAREARHVGELVNQLREHGEDVAQQAVAVGHRLYKLLSKAMIHDLRNLLWPLQANVERLQLQPKASTAAVARIDQIARQLAKFVEAAEAYAGDIPLEREPQKLKDVLQEASQLASEGVARAGLDPKSVHVMVDVPAGLRVEMARQTLVAAFANLIKNSYEAYRDHAGQLRPGRIVIETQQTKGQVIILVTDSGKGISDEDLKYLLEFVPGRRDKTKPLSTGFGLPIANRFIEAHDGSLAIISQLGKGTKVRIKLPTTQWRL